MKYSCLNCDQVLYDSVDADLHEKNTGHKVELQLGSTYWGEHLIED